MDTDKPPITELDASNYAPWYYSLKTYSAHYKATAHLVSNPPLQSDPAQQEAYDDKRNRVLSAILGSVPNKILGQILVPDEEPSPYDLVQRIVAKINQSSKEDHKYLKTEAESIQLKISTKVSDFFEAHDNIRQKMLAAKYPNIDDEETTVDFIIAGLKSNPSPTPILAGFIATKPITINELKRSFNEFSNLYTAQQAVIQKATPSRFTGDYGYTPRPYRGYHRRQWMPPRRRLQPNQVPCQFHLSLGIPPQHTDIECRDPRHPKHRQNQPQAHYAQVQYPYPR